jgi:hypothetical protein
VAKNRNYWFGPLCSVAVVLSGTVAWAADAEENKPPPAPVLGFMAGPSMHETGRIGFAPLSDSGSKIEQIAEPAMPNELSVQRAAVDARTPASAAPSGVINAGLLESEIQSAFADLGGCRLEVARRKQVAMGAVAAGRLTLRWTITPAGSVGETEVVAVEPVDIQVMDCVKRRMSFWSFARPRGGAVRLERTFAFR